VEAASRSWATSSCKASTSAPPRDRSYRNKHGMFRSTEANVSCNNLSTVVTHEHVNSTSSPTCLQLIGGGGMPGESDRSSPDTPGPAVSEDAGAGTASPEVALLGTPVTAPRITQSCSNPLVSSLDWGPAPSTLTLAVPSDAPSAPSISHTGTSRASDVGSSDAEDSSGDHGQVTHAHRQRHHQGQKQGCCRMCRGAVNDRN
jgi:hypothetical protein